MSITRRVKRADKLSKITRLLLFRSRGKPGINGKELQREIGDDFLDILKMLNSKISELGLTIRGITDEGEVISFDDKKKALNAWFIVALKNPLLIDDLRHSGWRIDELAVLSMAIVHIISMRGKASRNSIIDLLKDKIQIWRINYALDKFIRIGYLKEDEKSMLSLNWRTYAEIDIEKLISLIIS